MARAKKDDPTVVELTSLIGKRASALEGVSQASYRGELVGELIEIASSDPVVRIDLGASLAEGLLKSAIASLRSGRVEAVLFKELGVMICREKMPRE